MTNSNSSYRGGLIAVAAAVLLSLAVCLPTIADRPTESARAAHDLGTNSLPLGRFTFTERSGRTITDADLADRVWVASFIFTRCPSSCPRISAVMKGLQGKLAGTEVQLVSISVDPEHDTPAVLKSYADALGANAGRWWFLTGSKDATYELLRDRFKVPVAPTDEAQRAAGAEDIAHSARLALVGPANCVLGYYDANDSAEVEALAKRVNRLANPWAVRLPSLNAVLNGTCAVLLLAAWWLIRKRRIEAHRNVMLLALVVSAVFLTSYLLYHFVVVRGSVPFQGVGRPLRLTYFTILLSHTALAIAMLPLVALTVFAALRGQFDKHTRWSKRTFPIWLYVSITGVVVYVMLYRM